MEPRWEQRSFRHTEFTTPNVRSYDANGYASFALVAGLYPFARGGSPLWQGLGLTFRYARAFGFDSESARFGAENRVRPLPVDTYFWRYDASLRYRIAVNPQGRMPLELAVSAGSGGWSFDFGSDLPRAPDLEAPTADYRMLRLGFDAAARLPPVTFFASFGYLHAFSIAAPSSRELDDLHYPHLPSAAGIGAEMRGAVGVTIWQKLEVRLSAEYAVLAFHLKPLPGRADAPARVVDAYLSIGLGPYVSF
ncbi:MAG TPA: hypothetical protein VK550_22895 [Polyangiaceae bacterium]|nr:hypothetical protein [Polyangiaceae bacterium]